MTINNKLSGVKPEIRKLHGRDHYVVPTVMMVEGVHNGSSGAGYYPAEVMRKVDIAWNSKPIVLGHPKSPNGEPLLASSADVLNEFQVGILCNTSTGEDCRQVSEAWLDKSLLETKAPELATSVANGEIIEVSTGFFLEADMSQGVWNNEAYAWKAVSLQPDHFAIVLDGVGACSVNDGAGLCRNEEGGGADKVTDKSANNATLKIPSGISLDAVREAVYSEILSKYPDDPNSGIYTYVAEIFPDSVIFRTNGELFSITWSLDANGRVSLTGIATPVVKEVTYKPIGNSSMTKEQKVAAIIAANKGFDATKQAELLSLNDATLDAIHANVTAKPVVVNEMAKLAEVVAPTLLTTINAAVELRTKARQAKITAILASGAITNQAELETASDAMLDGMAALAARPVAQAQTAPIAGAANNQQAGESQPSQPQLFGTSGMPFGISPLAAFNAGAAGNAPSLPAGFSPSLPSYVAKK